MAGLLRPFIKMSYEPAGLSGSNWPRLGRQEAQPAPCLYQRETLFPLLPPPRLRLSTLQCAPCPCLMKEKASPHTGLLSARAEFSLRKLFSCKWQAPGDKLGPGHLVTCAGFVSVQSSPISPGYLSLHSLRGGEQGGCGQPQAGCSVIPVLSRRSEAICQLLQDCLAFYVFVFFLSFKL